MEYGGLSPPSADPVLGCACWRRAFTRDAVALVRMKGGQGRGPQRNDSASVPVPYCSSGFDQLNVTE